MQVCACKRTILRLAVIWDQQSLSRTQDCVCYESRYLAQPQALLAEASRCRDWGID